MCCPPPHYQTNSSEETVHTYCHISRTKYDVFLSENFIHCYHQETLK